MKYSKIQKFISSFVIFSLLFSITFRIPISQYYTYAGSNDFFNLVSIIVDEDTYDEISSYLKRYSEDIQGVLENTRVVILPTPKNTDAFNIASLNESLYFEGYKSIDSSVDFESKLVGTVLVGDFNLPIVYSKTQSSKTILPFTDFEDKVYIYNNQTKKYEVNSKGSGVIKSEIWHGVISPNSGDFDDNIKGLKDYFDKNHDYYSGTGNFKYSDGIINGKEDIGLPSTYQPYVFFNDQLREEKSLSYDSFKSYEGYLSNIEDIVYNRFTKDLSTKLTDSGLLSSSNSISGSLDNIKELSKNLGKDSPFYGIDEDLYSALSTTGIDLTNVPDIQLRNIIENVTKKFIEIFSEGTLGEFRKSVHNAGRYNKGSSNVNVDMIPQLISQLDVVYSQTIKDINNSLEEKIDSLVINGLSRDLAIPTKIYDKTGCGKTYQNYLYGTKGEDLKTAQDCSIYRGTTQSGGQLVEANRGLNINLLESDKSKLDKGGNVCYTNFSSGKSFNGWWGGNTSLNLNVDVGVDGMFKLKSSDLDGSITSLYDIGGSSQKFDSSKIPSPLNCLDNNLILAESNNSSWFHEGFICETDYRIPTFGDSVNWSCINDNNNGLISPDNSIKFEDSYNSLAVSYCEKNHLLLDGNIVKSQDYVDSCSGESCECEGAWGGKDFYFKKVPSYIFHKSPTQEELKGEIEAMTTPSLPIDKYRYVDFVSPLGNLIKINYPSLFRINGEKNGEVTYDSVSQNLEKVLNKKSQEINDILDAQNPSTLSGINLEIYNLLKSSDYPSEKIDLLQYLKDTQNTTLSQFGVNQSMTNYDTLVFALFWNSLDSVSAKYGFVFDYYLNDQSDNAEQKYFLPSNKKQYEISYIGAQGDARNMYVKLDPEGKADNPYADIISQNIDLVSSLLASNVGNDYEEDKSGMFECAPPDGVPIWEWIPAVMCRLGEMLPPTISFSDGMCGETLLSNSNSDYENGDNDSYACYGDSDRNGVNDCAEDLLTNGGILELASDSQKYYFNKTALLKAAVEDLDGNIVTNIDGTKIHFDINKIEVPIDETKDFVSGNTKVVYDFYDDNNNDRSIISKYVSFNDAIIRTNNGISSYSLTTKNKEANIYLTAYIQLEDYSGDEIAYVESDPLMIQVRGDKLFTSSYKIKNNQNNSFGFDKGTNIVKVSDKANIYLVDGTNRDVNQLSNVIGSSSLSEEKLVLSLENLSKTGNNLPISYPLEVKLLDGDKVLNVQTITKTNLNNYKALYSIVESGSYSLKITDSQGFSINKEIEVVSEKPNKLNIELGTSVMQTGGDITTNFVTIYDKFGNVTSGEYYDIKFEIDGKGIAFLDNNSDELTSSTYQGYKIFRLKSTNKEDANNINIVVSEKDGDEILQSSINIETIKNISLSVKPLSGNIKVGGGTYKYEVSLTKPDGTIINNFNSRVYLIADSIFLTPTKSYVEIKNGIAQVEFKTKTVAGKNIPIEFQVEGLTSITKKELNIYPDVAMKMDLLLSQDKIEASKNSYSTLTVELKDRYNNLVFNDNTTKTNLEILKQYSNIITVDKTISDIKEGKTTYKLSGTSNPGIANFKVSTNPGLEKNSFVIKDDSGELTISGIGENASQIQTYYFWNKSKIEGKKYNSIYTTLLGSDYGDITQQDYLAGSLLFEKNNRSLAVTSLLVNPYEYSNILKLNKNGALEIMAGEQDLSQDISVSTKLKDNKLALTLYNKALNIYIGDILYNFDDDTKLIACEKNLNIDCIDSKKTSINIKSNSDNYKVYLDGDKLLLRDVSGKNLLEIQQDGTINRFGTLKLEYDESNETNYLLINVLSGGNIIAKINYNFVNSDINISRNDVLFDTKIDSTKNSILALVKTNSYGTYNYGSLENTAKIFYYNDPFDTENKLNSFTKNNIYGYENFVNKSGLGWQDSNKSLLAFSAGKNVGESVKDYMSFGVINLGDPVISLKKIQQKLPDTSLSRKFDSTIGKLLSNDSNIVGYSTFDYNKDLSEDILLIKKDKYLKLLENINVDGNVIDKGNLAFISDLGDIDNIGTGDFTGDGYEDIFFVSNDGEPYLLNNVLKNFTRYSLVDIFNLGGSIVRAKVFDMDNDGKDDIVTLDDSGEINILYASGNSNTPTFTKLKISENNGITLNGEPRSDNGLVYFDGLHQPSEQYSSNSQIDSQIYVEYPYTQEEESYDYQDYLDGNFEIEDQQESLYFLKSEYAKSAGLKVEKTFKDSNGGFLKSGDTVETQIVLTNISGLSLKDVIYQEKVLDLFTIDDLSIVNDKEADLKDGIVGYNFMIDGFDLGINQSITITYKSKVKSLKYSYIDVGLFEGGELGDDLYGDVIVKEDNKNCGDTVDIYRSTNVKTYEKGTKIPECNADKIKLPEELEKNSKDDDGNGIPDYIDDLMDESNSSELKSYSETQLNNLTSDTDDVGSVTDEISDALDSVNEYVQGLSCGFGGGSCISTPLNWAPLASGSDPVFMGRTIGDGLMVGEGYPIFSLLTGMQTTCGNSPCCIPSVWPVTSSAYVPGPVCGTRSAGGSLGTWSPFNTLRIFVTPTLTGGIGVAMCFGGPAIVAGNSVPEMISPLTPGGNCVIIAGKFSWCGDDGSDGDPASTGVPTYSIGDSGDEYGVIAGNCSESETKTLKLKESEVGKYFYNLDLSEGGSDSYELSENMFSSYSSDSNGSMFNDSNGVGVNVSINSSALSSGNFEDIIQIDQSRISAFPSWLMDWVTRQIEEIANKLTDFPTLFIILPDFSGIFDGSWSQTSGNDQATRYSAISSDENLTNVESIDNTIKKVNSGIKEAYEFIGSIPLVYIEQEIVDVSIPWISGIELDKTIVERKMVVSQRGDELERAKNAWSYGKLCNQTDAREKAQCQNENAITQKFSTDLFDNIESSIDSINQNLEVLEDYKNIPEKINKLISKKQDYLEQILCNIDSISYMLGGRIGENGERFKAWVEAYILIKAILKSWQGLVDVFLGYEEECHDCKNERQDALESEFSLISFLMPKIPIIRFPKWPDIILDLHNIRAGLRIPLPEFNINTRPLILPTLPTLTLPDTPNLNLSIALPEIPILPLLEIPELPDLPSIPTVELPDLPPPPKLPKILSEIQVVVDIIKLISKAMCILKSSPLHPEWRAGDQIAFLTERGGYLPTDFIEGTLPEFSFPFVDAIKISTYVNLEFETEFIVELARQIVDPINSFTNDFVNIFNSVNISDIDLQDSVPSDISVSTEVGYNYKDELKLSFANRVVNNILHLHSVINEEKSIQVDNNEFKLLVNKSLSSKSVTSNPKMDGIRKVWQDVNNLTYSKENSLIQDLKDTNIEKFQALKDIINTEIVTNKNLKEKINNVGNSKITEVSSSSENKIDLYNQTLGKYNNKVKQAAKNLFTQGDIINKDLKEQKDDLIESIKTPLQRYGESMNDKMAYVSNNQLSLDTLNTTSSKEQTSCQQQSASDSDYKYVYDGIYILEGNSSYRLFDYLDELDGEEDEKTQIIDIDNDGDQDLLYFVNGQLFLKENLEKIPIKNHVSTPAIIVGVNNNKFFNGDVYYEAVNNAKEVGKPNGRINLKFSSSTNKDVVNYRVGFYTLVDKYLNENNQNYIPENINKDLVDAIAGINNITKVEDNSIITKRKNLVYINNVGNLKNAKLITKQLINISNNIVHNQVVNISKGTTLYAGGESFKIQYIDSTTNKEETLKVDGHSNVEFKKSIKIIGIDGNAYIKGENDVVYEGMEIINRKNKPLFPGSKITYIGDINNISNPPYIELTYYDDSQLNIDFETTKSWELYDLGNITNDYFIAVDRTNDYYYAKINSFKHNINSTLSNQILLAPQSESDQNGPELSLDSIKIPVYQTYIQDFSSYVYEYGGVKNIKDIKIDFNLGSDTDGNGNTKDDNDGYLDGEYKGKIKIEKSGLLLKVTFGKFDTLFNKKIGITLTDKNGNVGYSELNFEVYSPNPSITNFLDGEIHGVINETLTDEPVNIYRYRGGSIVKLDDINGKTSTPTNSGNYLFNVNSSSGGLVLFRNGKEIALIDENTGKISLKEIGLQTKIVSSNSSDNDKPYPKISILSSQDEIFYEYLKFNGNQEVSIVNSFDEVDNNGIYFRLSDRSTYNYYTIPDASNYSAGSLSIYKISDTNKTALATIYKDGRIDINNNYYKLEYLENDKYVEIKILDSNLNKEVGRILFVIKGEYLMK